MSLYVHVPFCAHKCGYCDFYSRTELSAVESFIAHLEKEIQLYASQIPLLLKTPLETIFFGGGTPSILTPSQFTQVTHLIKQHFNLSHLKEWTIEVNPESFSTHKAEVWVKAGVNRLSFGVQSLDDTVLKKSERIHTAKTALAVLNSPILNNFDSISADVIYGLPGQTETTLNNTFKTLCAIPILKHISAYELTIAESIPFASQLETLNLPAEEKLMTFIKLSRELLEKAGFERYEISNFAKPGFASTHNQNYWNGTPYIGLGPGAHGYFENKRVGNIASQQKWEEALVKEGFPWELHEELTKEMRLEEYLMLRLRSSAGFMENEFKRHFQEDFKNEVRQPIIQNLMDEHYLMCDSGRWFLSNAGMDRADGIAVMLLG